MFVVLLCWCVYLRVFSLYFVLYLYALELLVLLEFIVLDECWFVLLLALVTLFGFVFDR